MLQMQQWLLVNLLFAAIATISPSLASSPSPPHSSLHVSAAPLLSFLRSLPRSSQLLLQWNHSLPTCLWPGVSCSPDAAVSALNLSDTGLSGPLAAAAPRLCRLPSLLSLDLGGNRFTGPIPPELGACSRLRTLHLDRNRLSGPIPAELFQSPVLELLDVSSNSLAGPIPRGVSAASRLKYLGLHDNSLSGEVPEELFLLPNLQFCHLSKNNLTGRIPQFPPHCAFSELYVYRNMLSGELPPSLAYCRNLTQLVASYNNLVGTLPDVFSGLPGLELLYLENNGLIGELPRSLEKLENLRELVISSNGFNGTIPEGIGRCRSLTMLSLWGNRLTGRIPSSIGDLSELESLLLSQNRLVGPLPPELGRCGSLQELELQENCIGGAIPPEIGGLKNLGRLFLFKNRLEGSLPREIGNMSSLYHLQLYNNSLTGSIPTEITLLRQLSYLSLHYNNLTGEVPAALGRNLLGGLIVLDLTGNDLYGPMPPDLCAGGKLNVLAVGRNRFNGSFPVEIIRCASLRRVILSHNHLRGNLPGNLGLINLGISYLDLSSNLFEGSIPPQLGHWSNLSMLDISSNSLSGPVPPELGNLGNLESLRISSNSLTGSIPPELGNCAKLLRLDLSRNQLSGSIPVEVVTLLKLQSLILSGNKLSGSIPDSFTAVQSLLELQLGDNMLEGSIPHSIGNLQYIYLALNLSNNRLTGEIPASLGNLDKLQLLDLSHNSLSGQIPSLLGNMISLSVVNVSFNQLNGKLPPNWVKFISTSPASFLGNQDLFLQQSSKKETGQHGHKTRWVVFGAVLCGVILLVVAGLFAAKYAAASARRLAAPWVSIHSIGSTEELPDDLTYEDILRATEDLSEKYVIGRGRHGTVYRTEFGIGRHWAVKIVDLSQSSFSQEVRILNLFRHRNLMKMAGYRMRDGVGVLVFEYMSCGTLFELLHQRKPQVPLDWKIRHRIALGIAQGLSYLHHDCVPPIIHRDVKSRNILLDPELEPKIGDFGMAKMMNTSDASSTISSIVGTLGYIAPEHGYSTKLNEKCDVYSYGVVILELLCRKLPVDPSFGDGIDIVHWVESKLHIADCSLFDCFDEEICYWMEDEKVKALKLLELAISCTQLACEARPSMREVVGILMKLNM